MSFVALRNQPIKPAHGRTTLLDIYHPTHSPAETLLVFAHGFKGFKDWGHWHLLARRFANAGHTFLKFNFAFNGTDPENATDFVDLEAFGQNNYTKELQDLEAVLEWLEENPAGIPDDVMPLDRIVLVGHSRGGGTTLVKAARDTRVHALISWASVSGLDYAWKDAQMVERWKEKGVYYVLNSRTDQQMPMYYQIYEDFEEHRDRYSLEKAAKNLDKPHLIVHGTEDPAVSVDEARHLASWNPDARLELIEGADHVFSGSHPYEKEELPRHSKELLDVCLDFLDDL